MERNRGYRRWQAEKAKQNAREYMLGWWRSEEPTARAIGINAKSHGCPCPQCRVNARLRKYDRVKDQGWKREAVA